jgi:hypothetical protein
MTKHQTLEQWLADEEQKQKTRNSELDKEELITQINQLNLKLAQEKKVSQALAENWKKAEKEWVTVLANYRNWKRKDELTNTLIISVSIIIGCIIYYPKQKEKKPCIE